MGSAKTAGSRQRDAVHERALQRCVESGADLTELRERVLSILHKQARAIGAYELAGLCGRDPANVPSLYRVLKFWCGLGVVTHLAASNTFVLTELHAQTEATLVFVCNRCGAVAQYGDDATLRALRKVARRAKFAPHWPAIEISGVCSACSRA